MEPVGTNRLQSRARAFQGRPARRLLREFHDGILGLGRQRAEVWGRPAAIALAKDGALLVADDMAGTIWRVAYSGPQRKVEARPK